MLTQTPVSHQFDGPRGLLVAFLLPTDCYYVRDEATGPQEHDLATDSRDRQLLNGRLSSRPPRAVYYMNSLFWTTSSFSDNYKILLSSISVKSSTEASSTDILLVV